MSDPTKKPCSKKYSLKDFTNSELYICRKVVNQWKKTTEAHHRLRQDVPTRAVDDYEHFRNVPKTGVIYATSRAREMGFSVDDPEWANMGQGAPECGELPGQPKRPETTFFDLEHQEYAPVQGLPALRDAVAEHYNALYRKGLDSQYTGDNVCIIPGGRAGITRLMACLNNMNVGFFRPDYTAYEELLGLFRRINPIPMSTQESGVHIDHKELEKQINQLGLGGVLVSNPCNPTGHLLEGEQLCHWIDVARETDCLLIMDEFYSHYIYSGEKDEVPTVSSAEYILDVNKDPVVIVDGLTKNWRLPGWRVCWCVGPKKLMETMASAASYLDGGASNPLQKAAIPLVNDLNFIKQDIKALQKHFRQKRDIFLEGIQKLGIIVDFVPTGTFYVWGNLSKLPAPLDDCITFFDELLKEKCICVPGIFFDLNPGKRRHFSQSPFKCYCRFSYGPEIKNLQLGIKAIERVINKFKKE